MLKELNLAIKKQQEVSISTVNEEIYIGTPERISIEQNNVKFVSDRGVVFIPLDEIKQVMRLIQLH